MDHRNLLLRDDHGLQALAVLAVRGLVVRVPSEIRSSSPCSADGRLSPARPPERPHQLQILRARVVVVRLQFLLGIQGDIGKYLAALRV